MTQTPESRTLGRYALADKLGEGVVTVAYRARSFGVEGFEKTIVVKSMKVQYAKDPLFVGAFIDHVRRAMRLSHANLAQIFDLGSDKLESGWAYYLATEYVAGIDSRQAMEHAKARGETLPLALAGYIGLEVAKGLDHAHRRRDENLAPLGIVHGALAPHNVRVGYDGDVKITDFGLTRAALDLSPAPASLTTLSAAMSPEHASGTLPTAQSDVFSLGTLLYFLITGVEAFRGDTVDETRRLVRTMEAPPLLLLRSDTPPALAAVVDRALKKKPEDRFASMSELYEELLRATRAAGLRASAADVAAFAEKSRGLKSMPPPVAAVGDLLGRPLTVPPEAPLTEESGPRHTSIPPLTGFGELRHVTVLCVHSIALQFAEDRTYTHATVERYGGRLLDDIEHGCVAVFGLDRSDGRDTEVAVRAGLVLLRALDFGHEQPAVGIDAGRARVDENGDLVRDDRTSRLVNTAKALSSGSAGLLTASTRTGPTLKGRFNLVVTDRGISVSELTSNIAQRPFVGRSPEIAALGETLARASRGTMQLVSVVGEAGVGKTRLVHEIERRLSRGSGGLATHFATCPPNGREIPNSGIVGMLRKVCGIHEGDPPARIVALAPRLRSIGLGVDETTSVVAELGVSGAPKFIPGTVALRAAVARFFQSLSEDRFTLFVWDDAHELDAASCDTIARAVSRLPSSRLAVLFCARPDEDAPYRQLPLHKEIALGPMPERDIERMIALQLGLAQTPKALSRLVFERAAGHPAFAESLVDELKDSGALQVNAGTVTVLSLDEGIKLPRSLRALTSERLRRLSSDERHLFVAAAVLEPPVDVTLLAGVVGQPQATVDAVADQLIERGLLGRDGRGLDFPSPLPREVVLAELDPAERANLHRRAAEALREMLGDELLEEADRVGYHLAAAGDQDDAAACYAKSGLHHLGAQQLDRAAFDLATALELADFTRRNPADLRSWLHGLTTAVRYSHTGSNLPALAGQLENRISHEAFDPRARVEMRVDLATLLGALDDQLAGETMLVEAAREARTSADLATLVLAARADLAATRGDFKRAKRALDVLARATVVDPSDQHRILLSRARTLAAAGSKDEAEAALADAARIPVADNALHALDRASTRVALHVFAGDFQLAADAAVQAAAQAEELNLLHELGAALAEQAIALVRLGEFARAEAAVTSARNVAQEINAERILLRCRIAESTMQGSTSEQSKTLELKQLVAQAESRGWLSDALLGRYLSGRAAAAAGEIAVAKEELGLSHRIATSTGNQAQADLCSQELAKLGS